MAARHFVLLFICPIIGILCEDSNKYTIEDDIIRKHSPSSETPLSNDDGLVAKTLTWLVNHVQELERKLEAQEKVNKKLEYKIESLEYSVETCRLQLHTIRKIKDKVSNLENIFSKYVNGDIAETSATWSYEKKKILPNATDKWDTLRDNGVFKKVSLQKRNVIATPNPRTLSTPTENPVAFSAHLSASEAHLGRHQTIIFDLVVTNIGNHYNQYSGMFTVPRSGIYVFSWTIGCEYSFGLIITDIVVNASIKSGMTADSRGSQSYASATGLVVLHVNKNDVVHIRTNSVNEIIGGIKSYPDNRSTFSGWLLA